MSLFAYPGASSLVMLRIPWFPYLWYLIEERLISPKVQWLKRDKTEHRKVLGRGCISLQKQNNHNILEFLRKEGIKIVVNDKTNSHYYDPS